jgi:uncharacterized membrane protein
MKSSSPKSPIIPHLHQQEDRQRFQVERMILFTDAVFAIAITLLILEIKIPNLAIKGLTNDAIIETVFSYQATTIWIGFIISFWVIALYWIDHHRTFAYVDNYDGKLVFLNLLFLMSIAIMPFTSALYSKYLNFDFPTKFYCYNVAFTGFVKLRLWYYIINPKNKISNTPIDPVRRKYQTARSWIAPLVFLFTALMISETGWSRLFFFAIFIFQIILGIYFKKKYGLTDRFK